MFDLPNYQLTRHAQAKRLRLTVDSLGNVKVTAPKRVANYVIEEFIRDNLDWIKTASVRQKDPRISHPDLGMSIPQKVTLKALNKTFEVSPVFSRKSACVEKAKILYLYGQNDDEYEAVLKAWLKNQAKDMLLNRLDHHAKLMGLKYNKVFIKKQKTRWGSCSLKKNINLNQNLIFFDMTLVDYLLIHELSHIPHPNHSSSFWRHVQKFDANYKIHDKALNHAARHIPLWALS